MPTEDTGDLVEFVLFSAKAVDGPGPCPSAEHPHGTQASHQLRATLSSSPLVCDMNVCVSLKIRLKL